VIDLALGPEWIARQPAIDEHDFYAGRYLALDGNPAPMTVEVVLIDLSSEQTRHFRDHLEWWDARTNKLIEGPPPEQTAAPGVVPALRVQFVGSYDVEEDDFVARTYFQWPILEDGRRGEFRTRDKRICGFLLLRTLRTGSRALSLERGSSLDIILNLKEVQLQMWEKVLQELRRIPVAEDPELDLSKILKSVQDAVRTLVPSEWADEPRMRVSDLTRETLRKTLTVFMATGAKDENGANHSVPFQHQGSGTINILVLAMLSLIAEQKQNVIFAMEEPEIAIPPHTQKRIVNSVRSKSAQALFTSHSPYVLEEFPPEQIVVLKREADRVLFLPTTFPAAVKPKHYRQEWRTRFAEALLARRVLLAEGHTEYQAFPAAARRLHQLDETRFKTLEALGIAAINAGSDNQISPLGAHFRGLGKEVFAVFDRQEERQRGEITANVDHPFESPESGFERLLVNQTAESGLRRFALGLVTRSEWPPHLSAETPTEQMPLTELQETVRKYLQWSKGSEGAAELLDCCDIAEMPEFIRNTIVRIGEIVEPLKTNPLPALDTPVPAQS
jgi:putative ATP-dependent endonuclease of the OLD family